MTEEEYRAAEGVNYSALAQFNQSPDHALMPFKPKSYFEIGKMFETMLQDTCKGTDVFSNKYFRCNQTAPMPENLIHLIETKADLKNEYEYKKGGGRNNIYKTKHAYLDECLENPGAMPVSRTVYDMLITMMENMLKMEVMDVTVYDVLSNAQWQVPIFWEKDGIKKKALFDNVLKLDNINYLFDIKTSANEYEFSRMSQNKYWIQRDHYTEGALHEFGGEVHCFTFLVAYKEAPFLCEPVNLEGDRLFEYDELCTNYVEWVAEGRQPKGYLPERKIYLRS